MDVSEIFHYAQQHVFIVKDLLNDMTGMILPSAKKATIR